MAQNFIQEGDQIEIPILAAVVTGAPVLYGTKLGIPLRSSTVVGEPVSHRFAGVFEFAKTTSEAWAVGAALYWNDTTKKLTTTASGNTLVAWAAQPAIAAATTGQARLIE
jgi:predicted RecA/RadA family phage recombinase